MKNEQDVYKDWNFGKAYTDVDEWRETPIRHRYVHGGVEGTELKFSFYFPPVEQYQGRFYHFMAPAQGSENASQVIHGEEDKISFAIAHGAYFVESNMGGGAATGEVLLQNNAATAVYSRIVAARIYGEHRPYVYIYGGSGGSFKTCACFENTEDIWDGAVPFVIGTPMAMPNAFTVRAHAMRVLRHRIPQIIDAVEVGGSGDPYVGLNDEERAALEEVTKMGFPPRTWFAHYFIGDGALPVLTPLVSSLDPTYYEDFWRLPGYLGADPTGSACRDRIQFTTRIQAAHIPDRVPPEAFTRTGVDDAWHIFDNLDRFVTPPSLTLDDVPTGDDLYLHGTSIIFVDGAAAGQQLPLGELTGNRAVIGESFRPGLYQLLSQLKAGDTVRLDNSDYIALQTYHRHQMPADDYAGWRQFRDADGNALYPQRPAVIGPQMAYGGAGGIQNGRFKGKMIVLASLMDESAFPYFGDWYRQKVREHRGDRTDDAFRLWYMDNAMHAETEGVQAKLHVVGYLGALQQALLDITAWVEKDIAPPTGTNYTVRDAQVIVPPGANVRAGIQPTVSLLADGGVCAHVSVGQPVSLAGAITVPNENGQVLWAQWDFEEQGTFDTPAALHFPGTKKSSAIVTAEHVYAKSGTYFPVLRAAASRTGSDPYTVIKNLGRVRVVVS